MENTKLKVKVYIEEDTNAYQVLDDILDNDYDMELECNHDYYGVCTLTNADGSEINLEELNDMLSELSREIYNGPVKVEITDENSDNIVVYACYPGEVYSDIFKEEDYDPNWAYKIKIEQKEEDTKQYAFISKIMFENSGDVVHKEDLFHDFSEETIKKIIKVYLKLHPYDLKDECVTFEDEEDFVCSLLDYIEDPVILETNENPDFVEWMANFLRVFYSV